MKQFAVASTALALTVGLLFAPTPVRPAAIPDQPQAAPPAPCVSRRTLVPGDPLRDWLVVWRYDGLLTNDAPTLGGTRLVRRPLSESEAWYDAERAQCWAVPAGMRAGDYRLTVGGTDCGPVTVAPANRVVTPLWIGGAMRLSSPWVCEPNTTYDFRGLTVAPAADFKGEGAIRPADGATVLGGTFEGFAHLFDRGDGTGVVMGGVTQRGGSLYPGGRLHDLHLDGCRFENASTGMLGLSVCRRCRWSGTGPGPVTTVWASRAVFLDCEWNGTDRGVSFQTVNPVEDCLGVGLSFVNVFKGQNGNELLNVEGKHPFRRGLFHHVNAAGCAGCLVTLWDAPVDGFRLRDAACERNPIYCAGGQPLPGDFARNDPFLDVDQTGIVIEDLESGGVVECGRRVRIDILNSAFVSPAAGRHNQRGYVAANYLPRPVLRTLGTGTLRGVTVTGLPAGWAESAGFQKN